MSPPKTPKRIHDRVPQCEDRENRQSNKKTITDLGLDPSQLKKLQRLIFRADDDPPVIVDWNQNNLAAFVAKIANYAQAAGALPPPFPLPAALDPNNFAAAVLNSCRAAVPGSKQPIGLVCLPGTTIQLATYSSTITLHMVNPWYAAVDNSAPPPSLPLATVYGLRPRDPLGCLDPFLPQVAFPSPFV
mmetsp:Transcript_17820/g.30723  ORF Transcript_17820/g.30723 Transcript_17820/m.30723 type:complete len:188 (-) Transcript_17820:362-925(-)|eukprot:CAMPEP_0196660516 /NCGR_PEP_ID=MMETSP1086-20130531/40144_1 /TAXON_ID=77921 /ORGANISM="Cyanoptyche  gloeocystis , Strain SAG4.97" /LENGTH=187 /DNA_ID=CAMNT_0041994961 /DNA_START=111 /DNA_END=674 /DNA_ORIENTATION=+